MCWVLASPPWSIRSWSWLLSSPSEPRLSKCTVGACRSDNPRETVSPTLLLLLLLQTRWCVCRRMMWQRRGDTGKERADLSANGDPPTTPTLPHPSPLYYFLWTPSEMSSLLIVMGDSREVKSRYIYCDPHLHFNNCWPGLERHVRTGQRAGPWAAGLERPSTNLPVMETFAFFWYFSFTTTQNHNHCKFSSRRLVPWTGAAGSTWSRMWSCFTADGKGSFLKMNLCWIVKFLKPEEPELSRVQLLEVARGLKCVEWPYRAHREH